MSAHGTSASLYNSHQTLYMALAQNTLNDVFGYFFMFSTLFKTEVALFSLYGYSPHRSRLLRSERSRVRKLF